jgi:hypothetical protein
MRRLLAVLRTRGWPMRLTKRAAQELRRATNHAVQRYRFPPTSDRRLVFILGCQRSGTTMLTHIFERDPGARVYSEMSVLSSKDSAHRIRLNPLADVKRKLDRSAGRYFVSKPLVESQRARELLAFFPTARILWLYRNYKDVVASSILNFGPESGRQDARAIAESESDNWRSQNVSEEIRALVLQHYRESMDPNDAAALFWYVRNHFFFEQSLDEVACLCQYEELVADPARIMSALYGYIEQPFPGGGFLEKVHARSVGAGKAVVLNPEIEALCAGMLEKLHKSYRAQAYFR